MFSLLLILFSFLYSQPSDLSREIPPKYFTPSGSIEALINDYDGIYYLVQLDLKNDSLYNIANSILPDAELFNGRGACCHTYSGELEFSNGLFSLG